MPVPGGRTPAVITGTRAGEREKKAMTKKANFLFKHDGILWYEYRGHEYLVNTKLWTSTAAQHKYEQKCIDAEIEREEKAKMHNTGKPVDLDEIWDLMGWD